MSPNEPPFSVSLFRNPGARFLLVAASLVVVVAGIRAAGQILLPIFVATFLSILSSPILLWLCKRRVPRFLAVVLTVLANMAGVAILVLLVSGSVNSFSRSLPRYQSGLEHLATTTVDWLDRHGLDTSDLTWLGPSDTTQESEAGEATTSRAPQFSANSVIDLITNTLRGVTFLLSNALIVLLTMIFILFEAGGLPSKIQRAFDLGDDDVARLFKAKKEVQRYLIIKTLVSLATGGVITIWVSILGVEFPLLWGLLAFLFNYIPNLGSILAAIPPVLLTLIDGGLGQAVAVGLGYLMVNMVIGNFIEPNLMGRRFGLSTLVVFLSLLFWGWLWGPVGMLLSVPLTMILKILLENTEDLRWLAVLLGRTPRAAANVP